MAAETSTDILNTRDVDRRFEPLATASGIGLAVSGGADSVALMRLAADWRDRNHPGLPMVAFTVDHQLRPVSGAEAARVSEWAQAAGLTHHILVWHGAKPGADIQAVARAARYRLLAEACRLHGLSHLATAHHLDDQAETVLLRLARGSGVDGLSAMPEQSNWPERSSGQDLTLVRPLLDVPKQQLVATLEAADKPWAGQQWIEDPSNTDTRFARARIRQLMPALAREGMSAKRLAATARRLQRARTALESAAADLHRVAVHEDRAGFCRIDLEKLLDAPEEIGLRVVSRLLMGIGGSDYPPRLERLERLYADLSGTRGLQSAPTGATHTDATLSGCRVVVAGDNMAGNTALLCRERGRNGLPEDSLTGPDPVYWDRRFRVESGRKPRKGLKVRALGIEGVAAVKQRSCLRDMPVVAARVTPGVFIDDQLIAAPLVEASPGLYSPREFEFAFVGAMRFATGERFAAGGAT